MEKIVQYPLSIPPLLTSQIVRMLDVGLTEILTQKRVETSFDKQRFGDIILKTMPSQLATPRAVDRFLAQVREQIRAHDLNEVNDVDLILATFLRVQFPDVFAKLQSRKADLTKLASSYGGFEARKEKQADWDDLLTILEREEDRRDAMSVLGALFPAVRGNNLSLMRCWSDSPVVPSSVRKMDTSKPIPPAPMTATFLPTGWRCNSTSIYDSTFGWLMPSIWGLRGCAKKSGWFGQMGAIRVKTC